MGPMGSVESMGWEGMGSVGTMGWDENDGMGWNQWHQMEWDQWDGMRWDQQDNGINGLGWNGIHGIGKGRNPNSHSGLGSPWGQSSPSQSAALGIPTAFLG